MRTKKTVLHSADAVRAAREGAGRDGCVAKGTKNGLVSGSPTKATGGATPGVVPDAVPG